MDSATRGFPPYEYRKLLEMVFFKLMELCCHNGFAGAIHRPTLQRPLRSVLLLLVCWCVRSPRAFSPCAHIHAEQCSPLPQWRQKSWFEVCFASQHPTCCLPSPFATFTPKPFAMNWRLEGLLFLDNYVHDFLFNMFVVEFL